MPSNSVLTRRSCRIIITPTNLLLDLHQFGWISSIYESSRAYTTIFSFILFAIPLI